MAGDLIIEAHGYGALLGKSESIIGSTRTSVVSHVVRELRSGPVVTAWCGFILTRDFQRASEYSGPMCKRCEHLA